MGNIPFFYLAIYRESFIWLFYIFLPSTGGAALITGIIAYKLGLNERLKEYIFKNQWERKAKQIEKVHSLGVDLLSLVKSLIEEDNPLRNTLQGNKAPLSKIEIQSQIELRLKEFLSEARKLTIYEDLPRIQELILIFSYSADNARLAHSISILQKYVPPEELELDEGIDYWARANELINEEMPPILEDLEKEFRKTLNI